MSQQETASALDRYRLGSESNECDSDVYDSDAEYRAFGVSRKAWGGEPMLNFIDRRGDHRAIAYSHLYIARYNPSHGIVIEFSDHIVLLRGRRLADGYQKLVAQRVVFVSEADRAAAGLVAPDAPVITEMRFERKRERSPDLDSMLAATELA